MKTEKFALRVTFLNESLPTNKYRFAESTNDTLKHSDYFDKDEEYQFDSYMKASEHVPAIIHNILDEEIKIEIISKEIDDNE